MAPYEQSTLSVGEVARRSGVSVSTVHYYERMGFVISTRTAGNQRRFERDTLRRIAFIRVAQRVGIPLADIGEALGSLPDGRTPTVADWARVSRAWHRRLQSRIDDLVHLRDDLKACIGCGCLSLRSCALQNPLDELGRHGSGPRRWM